MSVISIPLMVAESGQWQGLEGSFQGTASEKQEERLCPGQGLVKKLGGITDKQGELSAGDLQVALKSNGSSWCH